MNKQIKFLLLLALVSFSISCSKDETATPTQVTQFLKNGNLEGGIQNWYPGLDNLNPTNPNGFTTSLSQEFAASPVNSIKINCNKVVSPNAFCFYYQSFPTTNIKLGAKLTLKAKVKGVNLEGQGVSIAIRGDKKGATSAAFFKTTEGTTPITGNFDFKEFTVSLDSYAGNVDSIVVFLVYLHGTTGTAYIDDISLTSN
jgi:hypothetical protein